MKKTEFACRCNACSHTTTSKDQICKLCKSAPRCKTFAPKVIVPKLPATKRIHVKVTKADIKEGANGLMTWDRDPIILAINRSLAKFGKRATLSWAGKIYLNGKEYTPAALKDMWPMYCTNRDKAFSFMRTPRRFSFRLPVEELK